MVVVKAPRSDRSPTAVPTRSETDGALPSGEPLAEAIEEVDRAIGDAAAYFMVNCAHPSHFAAVLSERGPWARISGVRANASRMSHAELDNVEELDRGDEVELADGYRTLLERLPAQHWWSLQ